MLALVVVVYPPNADDPIVAAKADAVRVLKANKADKTAIDSAVKELMEAKAQYKTTYSRDWVVAPKAEPAAAITPAAEGPVTAAPATSVEQVAKAEKGNDREAGTPIPLSQVLQPPSPSYSEPLS